MGARKGGSHTGNDSQYIATQQNLDKKGKTNKKLKLNPQASKFLTSIGKELKEKAEAKAKAEFKKGRRTKLKEQRAKEAAEKEAQKDAAKNNTNVKPKYRNNK